MEPSITIALLISIVSITVSVVAFFRNMKKDHYADSAARVAEIAELNQNVATLGLKIDMLQNNFTEFRQEIKATNAIVQELDKDLTIVKRDLGTAWKRIDELKERINENERLAN